MAGRIVDIKRFRGAVLGLIAVALIAALVVLGLRYAAPNDPVVDRETAQPAREDTAPSTQRESVSPDDQTRQNAADDTQASLEATTIQITDLTYDPKLLTIKRGATVKWVNNDSVAHTVRADEGDGPDSASLVNGESYSYTFKQTGTFRYHCELHPEMKGQITVVE